MWTIALQWKKNYLSHAWSSKELQTEKYIFHGKGSESRKTEPGMEGGVFTSSSVFKRTEVTVIKFQVAIIPERWGSPTSTRAEKTLGVLFPAGLYFGGARF